MSRSKPGADCELAAAASEFKHLSVVMFQTIEYVGIIEETRSDSARPDGPAQADRLTTSYDKYDPRPICSINCNKLSIIVPFLWPLITTLQIQNNFK